MIMASFFASAQRPWLFGLASLVLSILTLLWLVLCFTAREQAWWNSTSLFFLGFAGAVVLALRGVRSALGIIALILASLLFALLFIMHFG